MKLIYLLNRNIPTIQKQLTHHARDRRRLRLEVAARRAGGAAKRRLTGGMKEEVKSSDGREEDAEDS